MSPVTTTPTATSATSASRAGAPRPRVLIIGCGFGGLEAVRALSKAEVEITLVDRTNHHLFQPLLYQVATAGLSAPAISAPIRHVLRREMQRGNLTILQAEVIGIDVTAHAVQIDAGQTLAYDHLIVAAGAAHSYFGRDDWAVHAPGLKTLTDAFTIRARVIGAFERAERCTDPAERQAWLTFVVIGAGPTGVEMAGTMTEIAQHTLPQEFRRIDSTDTRVVLLEGSQRVLGAFVPRLSQRAREQLEKLGVDVRTGCKVVGIDADGVEYETLATEAEPQTRTSASEAEPHAAAVSHRSPIRGDGVAVPGHAQRHRVPSKTVIWAAGVAASALGRSLVESANASASASADAGTAAGATLDRAGRVIVQPDLSLPGHPEIAVIGDLAAARSHPRRRGGAEPATEHTTPVPGVSPAAKQMGRTAAANLLRRLRGEATRPFRYIDYGNLATVGRRAAVVDLTVPGLGALRFSGYLAWLFWLFAHIYFLIGFRNRLTVMLDWAWAYWTYERSARVVAQPPTEPPGLLRMMASSPADEPSPQGSREG